MRINDAMMTQNGIEVFYRAPNRRISKKVAGIGLKFTIGSKSNENYEGSFLVQSV